MPVTKTFRTLGIATDKNMTRWSDATSVTEVLSDPTPTVGPVKSKTVTSVPIQPTFDDLGRHLADTTFCVVDLETTGGSPQRGSRITEVGAVKVHGGEVVGEFSSLVNPNEAIPAYITVLTGITNQMVVTAPYIAEVLPSFLEFARGSVLVAHNAPFDVGFLKHAARELDIPWPGFEVVDTAVVARNALTRDETRNVKLSTLAQYFGATTTPNHRALADARATVDVLHGLFERVGSLGVHTVEELGSLTAKVTPEQRRKRHLADHLSDSPGVYLFRDRRGEVLYVGTSRRLRTRVRSYFTKSETRTRMGEMVSLAERVDGVVCATPLEAQVRELRLIARHRPPYNRRSKFPEKVSWIKLTREPWPRLSIVRAVTDDGADYIGPFSQRRTVESALAALHDTFQIRQCAGRMPIAPRGTACALAEMGHCLAPCDGRVDSETYRAEVDRVRAALTASSTPLVDQIRSRMEGLSADERYEEAARWRDRLVEFLRGATRTQRLRELTAEAEIIAAAPTTGSSGTLGWDVHVIRYGRLAASGVLPPRTPSEPWVDALVATAETVEPSFGPTPVASHEETELIRRWLMSDRVRLVRGSWQAVGAGSEQHLIPLEALEQSRRDLLAG